MKLLFIILTANLIGLWSDYDEAVKADKPQDRIAILDKIISKSQRKRLAWDFYRAWNEKCTVVSSVNWKDYDRISAQRDEAFAAFNEPVINVLADKDITLDKLLEQRKKLVAAHHAEFYSGAIPGIGPVRDFIDNDYEFALWYLLSRGIDRERTLNELDAILNGRYPASALADFRRVEISGIPDKDLKARYCAYAERWRPGAVALLAEQRLIQMSLDSLADAVGVAERDYLALRERCRVFERRRSAYSGDEAVIAAHCTAVKSVLAQLDSREIGINADSTTLTLAFRNVSYATVEIFSLDENRKEKSVFKTDVRNTVSSFYVFDTVRLDLPEIDDGEYLVKVANGNVKGECELRRYSISAAAVWENGDWNFFAADYRTGRFFDDFELTHDGKQAICSLTAPNGRRRLSEKLWLYRYEGSARMREHLNGVLFKDSGAYHRGDTLHYKAILYYGMSADEMRCAEAGVWLDVTFADPEGKIIESRRLQTNAFGAVDGGFRVPDDRRGGQYVITLRQGDRYVCSSSARVDDYVLPDFDCTFDKMETFCFPGDTVSVKGRVMSWTGHNVRALNAFWTSGTDNVRNEFSLNEDGGFILNVPVPENIWWSFPITLTVQALTGETHSFVRRIAVQNAADPQICVTLTNATDAEIGPGGNERRYKSGIREEYMLLRERKACFNIDVFNAENVAQSLEVACTVYHGGKVVRKGRIVTPCELLLDTKEGDGEYLLELEAVTLDSHKREHKSLTRCHVIRLDKDAVSLEAPVEYLFTAVEGGGIGFDFGVGKAPVCAVASLYDENSALLWREKLNLGKGELVKKCLSWNDRWPDVARMVVFWFRDGNLYKWTHEYDRQAADAGIDFKWTRFTDAAYPASKYTFSFNAPQETETLVAVFDKSSERIQENRWESVARETGHCPEPAFEYACGRMDGSAYGILFARNAAAKTMSCANGPVVLDSSVECDAVPSPAAAEEKSSALDGGVPLRENFATTLFWNPRVGDGTLSFTTSDKTGTFVVSAFTHDKLMHNVLTRREMVVSLPVQLSVTPPALLRHGDKLDIRASVSARDADVSGTLALDAGTLGRFSKEVTVSRGTMADAVFALEIPASYSGAELRLTLVFSDSNGKYSDAVAVNVPVLPMMQDLTEAHSALLHSASGRNALEDSLRRAFVNMSGADAVCREVSLRDMVTDAIKPASVQGCRDLMSVTETLCVNMLYDNLVRKGYITGDERHPAPQIDSLKRAFSNFVNDDGGFAWLEGMKSSPVLTATVLERNAKLSFMSDEQVVAAIRYLDGNVPEGEWSYLRFNFCCPGISLAQYLHVRSLYAEVLFERPDIEGFAEFGKAVSSYLFPKRSRGLNAQLFEKTQRLSTLKNLRDASDAGLALLKAWGVKCVSAAKLRKSLAADAASLEQYAVRHTSGGFYYPNLVMPYRGLLSDEAYCHSMLCDLIQEFRSDISDGIRLWLMVQKETQDWAASFAFVNAMASVLDASDELMQTRVLSLSASVQIPYVSAVAAGNGMTVEREFRLTSQDGAVSVLRPGDSLAMGDRVQAVYKVWSAENRSYVRLNVPHYACLRPADQLSGYCGLWNAQGYRDVRSDCTQYWFESYPEEKTEIREEYFVTASGVFSAPVVEIECLYAPHYRANGGFEGTIEVR